MKTPTAKKFILGCLALLAGAAISPAASIVMTNSDATGVTYLTSSFTSKGVWNDVAGPSGINDYYTQSTNSLRTPADSTNYIFLGNSLTLQGPGSTSAGGGRIILKNSMAVTYTITNLVITNLGMIHQAAANNTNTTIAGSITASNGGWDILPANGPVTIAATVSGNGPLWLGSPSAGGSSGNVIFSGVISNYTGSIFQVDNASPLIFNNSLNQTYAGVIALTNTSSSVTVEGSGILTLTGANTYAGITIIGAGGGAAVVRAAATGVLSTNTISFDGTGNASTARLELTNGISLNNNITLYARANTTVGIENLSGNNTLSGTITCGAGGNFYTIQSDAGLLTLGTAGANALNASSGTRTNTLQGAGNGIIVGNITNGAGAVQITKAGTGTWTLSGSNTYSLGTFLSAGTLVTAGTNALGTNSVTVSGTGNATLDVATDGSDYPNAVNAGSSTIFTVASDVKTGSVGINHTLGLFSIGSGATPLQMSVISGPNVASGSPRITAPLLLSGGSGGTTIINPTTANMTFSSATASVTSKTLQLDGTSTGNAITGIIADGGANVITLLKTNTSTWTLSGANTYSGSTTIAQGKLALGSGGSIASVNLILAGGATFDVSADSSYALGGTQIFNASGTVNGNFFDSTGSQILPGGAGTVGTLTFNNNLTLVAGDTNKFDFTSSANDLIVVNGNFTNSPGSVINLASLPAGGLTNGTYTLFQVSGALGGSAANFIITGKPSPSRQSFNIIYTPGSPNLVQLQVVGVSASLVWLGTSTPWDITTTADWTNAAALSIDQYYDGDNVNFTDLGSALSPVLNTNVQPGSVTFNSANAYTLSGSGAINGSSGLTKSGAGTLTISTTNGYTGVTALNGGVVSIASITNSTFASPIGAALAAPANLTFNGGTLQYTGGTAGTDHGATLNAGGGTVQVSSVTATLVMSSPIVGSSGGGLTLSGSGTLALSGANTYNGNTTISGGTLQVGNGGATGNLGSGSTITDNGALVVLRTGTLALTNNIGGTGAIINNGTGTLTLSGSNSFTGGLTVSTGIVQVASSQGIGGTPAAFNPAQISLGIGELEASTSFNLADTNSGVTVNAGTIAVDSGMTLMISNQVFVTTSLTKSLPGTLILAGSNTISGTLNVDTSSTTTSDGALRIASTNALGGVQTIQVRNNQVSGSSTLQLDGTAGSINVNPATFNWLGRNNFVPAIENITGDNVWNPSTVTLSAGGSYYMFQCDAGSLTLPGSFPATAPTAGRIFSFAGPGYFSITGSFNSGGSTNISLFLTNNATVTLWSGNGYTGITSLQGGTLNAADGSSFGNNGVNGNIEIAPYTNETAMLNISNATVTAQRIIVAGVTANSTSPGTGTVNQMNGNVSASQWVTIGSGGSAAGNSGGTGTYNLSGGTLNVQNTAGGTQLEVANFTGSTGTLNLSGTGILSIQNNAYISMGANPNAGNGTVNQTGGTVTFYSDGGGTVGGTGILYLGKAAGLTSNYVYNLSGGTLQVPTITSASGNSQFYFNGGTLKAAKTNSAWMSGLTAANVSTGGGTIDSYGLPVTITQPLIHDPALGATADGGLTNLSSSGSGVLTLAGTNTYTGGTVVNSGTLNISGSIGTGAVTVSGGALTGTGTINGATDIQSGGTLTPGAAIGVLTINNSLSFESGSAAQFNFVTGSNSTAVVTGAVNVNGSTAVSINYISALEAVGTYPLIQYGSLSAGSFANLTPPTSPNPRFTFGLTNNTSAKIIALVVIGNPASLVWHGDGSGNYWDNAGSYQNWFNGGSPDFFYDGDTVLFNNIGSNTPSIYLTATVSPASVTVNSANNYDFAGSGLIAGPGSLTKSGSGTLTLEDNNTYTGPTIINGGTLQIGNGSTTGTLGSGNVTNNASLVLDRSDATVMPSPIYGSGSVTMAGSGSVTATSSNYYTGATLINSGIVYLPNSAGLGATNGTITVASGAQLYINLNVDIGANPLSLIGVGDGNGALRKGGAGTTAYNGAVTLTGNTTLTVDGNATLNLASTNAINGTAANANLTLAGSGAGNFGGPLALGSGGLTVSAGTWTLAPGNTFTGLTALNAGTTRINDASLGSPAAFTANQITLAGGTLEAVTNTAFIDGKAGFTLSANATLVVDSGATLTISNNISGASNLTKSSPGTLVLNGSNSFSGILYLDTGSNTANDGTTHIASPNALANIPATPGTPTIIENANNSGSSLLQLDGSAGNLNLPQEMRFSCRNNASSNVESLSGSNTFSGNIDINSGGSAIYLQSDAGSTLNISGNLQYTGTLNGSRTYFFTGAGNHIVNGPITAGVNTNAPINVTMSGTGTLTLANANTYPNTTVVSNGLLLVTGSINSTGGVSVVGGTLGGTGTINDAVSVRAGGTLSPGANGIGTLTISSNLTLAGVTYIEVSKTLNTGDQVAGVNNLTYGGTLFATNLSGLLTTNNSFTIFSPVSHSGSFSTITGSPGAGLAWSFNTNSGVLGVVSAAAPLSGLKFTASPVISGTSLNISATNSGAGTVYLLTSTNVAAPLNTWTPIWTNALTGSGSFTTNLSNAVNPGQSQRFYILSNTNN